MTMVEIIAIITTGILCVLCVVCIITLIGSQRQAKASWVLMVFVGVVSGVLIGIFGIGAFLVAYISRTAPDTDAFKGNLGCVFLIDNIFRTILYAATGILTKSVLLTALQLAPMMALGFAAGILLSKKLPERTIRLIVILLLIVNGVSLIAMSLRG